MAELYKLVAEWLCVNTPYGTFATAIYLLRRYKKEKQNFYRVKVKPLQSNNPKDWWKSIKRICGISKNQKINLVNPDSGEPLTSEESVECINDYLINLTKDYNKISNDLQLGGDDLDLPGPFDPPTKIIKHFAEQLSGPLTDIINTSFQEKCFGEIWKAHNCCPIPKSNPCTTVGDIRPIALTSVFSKIQESFALDWMLEDSRDCLSERQFGGIPRSSSVLALLEMIHTWFVALEKPKSVIRIVFLDFSKAFDLIDHNILLNDFKSSRFTTMVSLVPIRPVTEGKHRWIDIVF